MSGVFRVRDKVFQSGTHIMGILNATPDSFYPASRTANGDPVERALKMIEDGAEIIDVGGQSTRPGGSPVIFRWIRFIPKSRKKFSERVRI